MIHCIAIDDEPLALQQLSRYIDRIDDLDLVGTFYSADDARSMIEEGKTDLVFLDIDMPDCNGMEFAQQLSVSKPPYIIFTTAYPQYAVDGFRVDAVDYLLKPLSFSEMLEAVDKVKRRQRETTTSDDNPLYIKMSGTVKKIRPSDILYIKGLSEYVQIHTTQSSAPIVTLESMRNLEESLRQSGFMRVHRSYIVNLSRIDKASSSQINIANEIIPVGETFRSQFKSYLKGKI